MSYSVIPTDNFNREVKQLSKKHRSIKDDLIQLRKNLLLNPILGTHLGNNMYKIRMAITSKGKGKAKGGTGKTGILPCQMACGRISCETGNGT